MVEEKEVESEGGINHEETTVTVKKTTEPTGNLKAVPVLVPEEKTTETIIPDEAVVVVPVKEVK